MLLRRTFFLFSCLFISLTLSSEERFVKGQVLVQLEKGVNVSAFAEKFHAKTGTDVSVNKQVSSCWNMWLMNVKQGEERTVLKQLNAAKEVKGAQLNHYLSKRNNVPNDTQYPSLYNMNNSGQNGGTVGADIEAERAWDFSTGGLTADGDTIVIAVIDEGFYLPHEDLKFRKNYAEIPNNSIDDDVNGYIDDFDGWNVANNTGVITPDNHGTHVSGIAGAIGNNSQGVVGVCWNVQIMPVQLYDYTDAEVAAAYSYVYEQRRAYNISNGASGAFVVATNSSFGENFADPADYPLWCGMYDSLGSVGILSAGATVNSFADIDARNDMPTSCSSPHLITVTNTTRTDALAVAGYGATTVDLGAPGTSIISTKNNNTYGSLSGTSMATPHVAGTVALMFAAACDSFMQAYKTNPGQVALDVKAAILNGVDLIPSLTGKTLSGGRLNAFRSVLLLRNQYCLSCSLNIQVTENNISCKDAADGEIDIDVLNGTPPYIYDWSNGESTRNSNTLTPGNYFINMIDSNNCVASATVSITEPAALVVNVSVTHASDSQQNGAANAGVFGGTPPYLIKWSDADSTIGSFVNALLEGNYYVTVTDLNGCIIIDSFNVNNILGVKESELMKIKVFPNPAKHYIYVEPGIMNIGMVHLEIAEVTGKIVQSEKISLMYKNTITLHQLPPGVYFLYLNATHFKAVRKVIIE